MVLLFWLACGGDFPAGQFVVSHDQVVGAVEVTNHWYGQQGCVELYSSKWGTEGCAALSLIEEIDGGRWMEVDLTTGMGAITAMMRWQGEELLLPLGSRRGEFEYQMTIQTGILEEKEREQWANKSTEGIAYEKMSWDIGEFVLQRQGRIQGAIEFQGEEEPKILLFDEHWLTPEVTPTERYNDGPDIVLYFPIEPSLSDGQVGALRVNTLLRKAIVPSDLVPQSIDIQYDLIPGIPSFDQLQQLSATVVSEAVEREQDWVVTHGRRLLAGRDTKEECLNRDRLEVEKQFWDGYDLSLLWENDRCLLEVVTNFEQHRRYFQGRLDANTLLSGQ